MGLCMGRVCVKVRSVEHQTDAVMQRRGLTGATIRYVKGAHTGTQTVTDPGSPNQQQGSQLLRARDARTASTARRGECTALTCTPPPQQR